MKSNFYNLYLQGSATLEDIDYFVDKWHESDSDLELHEYLGLSKLLYRNYLNDYWLFKHRMYIAKLDYDYNLDKSK